MKLEQKTRASPNEWGSKMPRWWHSEVPRRFWRWLVALSPAIMLLPSEALIVVPVG